MSSRKKRKRQEERKQQLLASASSIGNQANETPPVEVPSEQAIAKPDKPAKKEVKQKPVKEEVKQEPVKQENRKTIIGFGSKAKSTTVHAISDNNQSALCDRRIEDIPINADLTPADCNCSSCKKYSIFKQALSQLFTTENTIEIVKAIEKAEEKEIEKTEEQEVETDLREFDLESEMNTIENKVKSLMKRMEKRLFENLTEKLKELIKEKPDYFIVQSATNSWSICHDKSRLIIVNGLTIEQAETLLPLYIDIPYKWDGQSKMPQEWMAAIKNIFKQAEVKPKEKKVKEKRVLKRINKKEKKEKQPRRVIRRRSRH